MSVRMTVMVEYVGITSAMLAKDRLKAIIKQDREDVPTYRWVEKWDPWYYGLSNCQEPWRVSQYRREKLRKYIIGWERRR